jgi:hypothetical protein
LPNIITIKSRRVRGAGHVACMGEERREEKFFVRKNKWKWRPLGRPRHRWEDNIKMDLTDVG